MRSLPPVGDGGHDGGISDFDKRASALEGKVDKLDDRVQHIAVNVAEIKGRVSQMPTISQVIYGNVGLAVAIAGLVFTIARAMK